MILLQIGENALIAKKEIVRLSEEKKNEVLKLVSDTLIKRSSEIIEANTIDMKNAEDNNISSALKDRLILTKERIEDMSKGLLQLIELKDPIGKTIETIERPNGLLIHKKVVPMGVIGIIYEARPNVTIDAFGLCFKTSNVVLLRGGKEAINSNVVLVNIVRDVLKENNVNPDTLQILEDTSRELANQMMKMNQYLDLLIPRGGAGLINAVIENATVPVIETGVGNCHVYVDEFADIEMAVAISVNAKIQRPGVCNSCETILVHNKVSKQFLSLLHKDFKDIVEIRGDNTVQTEIPTSIPATEEDYYTEFHDYIVAIKVVNSLEEAILHIDKYSTNHSEAIITNNSSNAEIFLNEVDSAAVYVNASTRFTDGFEFGFGAEIGISTQKLHARGPMGLNELTTTKYIVYGKGQVRN
jgi:glutamate-5-semialdehyde dehydrogenase